MHRSSDEEPSKLSPALYALLFGEHREFSGRPPSAQMDGPDGDLLWLPGMAAVVGPLVASLCRASNAQFEHFKASVEAEVRRGNEALRQLSERVSRVAALHFFCPNRLNKCAGGDSALFHPGLAWS